MSLLEAILLAIVEGITEFLPVSSTGHMIIVSSLLGIADQPFVKLFTVAVQLGAILSVLVLYWRRFLKEVNFYVKLIVAFLPAAVVGFLLDDYIDALLEKVWVVALNLLLGGIFFLFIDRIFGGPRSEEEQEPSIKQGFWIGCFQLIAMLPGVSRSAATIIGGLQQGLSRKTAAEFSFFLAVPTMFGATAFKMLKYLKTGSLDQEQIGILVTGNLVAFVVAMIAIKTFITYVTRYGFKLFGYYRIILGLLILGLLALGYDLQIV